MLSINHRRFLLAAISAIAILGLCFVGRIPQDPNYHLLADTKALGDVPNFWNVFSNLPFLVVGAFALFRVSRLSERESRTAYLVLSIGVTLVGLGSAYYHYSPSNESLLWDRLPMTVAFMGLFSMLLAERVVDGYHQRWLWALVGVGIAAALYWSWTEAHGEGDLRPYALVQFLPIVLMPLIMALFPKKYLSNKLLLCAFAWYFVAKALEHYDHQILNITGVIGGHPVKHVAAAIAVLCIVRSVPVRPMDRTC
jgi:surface polysaccharide O-acyltransferase-like enzyme